MGCNESVSSLFKKESDELLNKYYDVPYSERKINFKRFVRREFELYYEYISKAGNDQTELDNIFYYHQAAEKQILRYSKETSYCNIM